VCFLVFFFFSSRRRHTRFSRDWSSDVCSSDLGNIKVTSISTIGAAGVRGSRTGGAGGEVSLTSIAGLIEVGSINTSGGNGYTPAGGDGSRNGGDAGDIAITAQTVVLKDDLTAQGGERGRADNNFQNGAGGDIKIEGHTQLESAVVINTDGVGRGDITFDG